jgi:mannan endo-1,4-beta-mannosidase
VGPAQRWQDERSHSRNGRTTGLIAALLAIAIVSAGTVVRSNSHEEASDGDELSAGGVARIEPTTAERIPPTTAPPVLEPATTVTEPPMAPPPSPTPAPVTTSAPRRAAPPVAPTANPVPLTIRDGHFYVDGVSSQIVGVNASGAASILALGSPCGGTDVDLDLMFSLLPERALVRVWFTQRMATGGSTPTRMWDALDAVVAAAERAPSRPLLDVTLGVSAGYCDGGNWRDRAWYDGGYSGGPEPGMPNSYAGWVDEVVSRYAARDTVAIWEPVNEPDPSSCQAGYRAPCYGHTTCGAGATGSLAAFFAAIGGRIHELDPNGLVSTGGTGWCGWANATQIATIESTPAIDIVGIHEYENNADDLPSWVVDAIARARALGKPLLIGELGMTSSPGGFSRDTRADLLMRKVSAQLQAGAAGIALWVFGYGPKSCDLCLMPDDPVYPQLNALGGEVRAH